MTTPTPTTAAPDPVPLIFSYRNWRGEVSERRVVPIHVWFGETKYHPEPQWFLNANDLDRGDTRDFAMKDIGARAMQEAMSAQGGGEVRPDTHWARLVKRLLNPPFGTDTSERLLMGEAADAIRYLLERVSPASEALMAEVAAWRECALYDPTMEGPRFKGWDRSALDRCRVAAEKVRANTERQPWATNGTAMSDMKSATF